MDGSHTSEPPPAATSDHGASGDDLGDAAIVNALRSDRPRGAALLFDRFSRKVNRLVWRLLGADPDHDDIVHHIFCSIIGSIHTLKDANELENWVDRVTVNTVYAELRKRRARGVFLAAQRFQPRFGDLGRDVEARLLLDHASTLLQRMPPGERMVFVLHHLEGHTTGEISELCDFSLSTVKRRLASANERFDKLFKRASRTASAVSI